MKLRGVIATSSPSSSRSLIASQTKAEYMLLVSMPTVLKRALSGLSLRSLRYGGFMIATWKRGRSSGPKSPQSPTKSGASRIKFPWRSVPLNETPTSRHTLKQYSNVRAISLERSSSISQTVACKAAGRLFSARVQSSTTAADIRTPLPPPGSRMRSSFGGLGTSSMDAMKVATLDGVKNCPRSARRFGSTERRLEMSRRSRSRRSRRFAVVTAT